MKKHLRYLSAAAIGTIIGIGVLYARNIFSLTEPADIYSALCDAFFIPGILLVCFGLLGIVANSGQFDMLSYAGHAVMTLFTPFVKPENTMKYIDYKQKKAERRRKPTPCLLIVGGAFLLLAIVCFALYISAA